MNVKFSSFRVRVFPLFEILLHRYSSPQHSIRTSPQSSRRLSSLPPLYVARTMTVTGATTAQVAGTSYVPPYKYVTSYGPKPLVTGTVTGESRLDPAELVLMKNQEV